MGDFGEFRARRLGTFPVYSAVQASLLFRATRSRYILGQDIAIVQTAYSHCETRREQRGVSTSLKERVGAKDRIVGYYMRGKGKRLDREGVRERASGRARLLLNRGPFVVLQLEPPRFCPGI